MDSYSGTTLQQALPKTAVQHAKDQLSKTVELSQRIDDIVSRIVGSWPDVNKVTERNPLNLVSSGILPDLSESASVADAAIDRAFSALNRLEKAL